jgi:hypothetical protein
MKKISKLFLPVALILILLTAACGADEGTTPTLAGTNLPGTDLTDTPGVDTTGTVETAGTAETATTEQVETPTSTATVAATEVTTTETALSKTPGVPVTGVDIILIECQFCVDTMAHALLVLPDTATFKVVSLTTTNTSTTAKNDVTCSTVEVNNGKQVVLCSAPEKTPLTLNICTDTTTCTDFPVDLLPCPLVENGTAVPTKETQTVSETPTSATTTPIVIASPTATP